MNRRAGTLVTMPLVGNLSDKCGRKALLTVPMILTIIPLANNRMIEKIVTGILGYSRNRTFFYIYFVAKTLTAMICEGSVHCLALAYVADNVAEERRASTFGVLSGIGSSAFVCGTLFTRFLSTSSTFQVATSVAVVSAMYLRIFLPDSNIDNKLSAPLLSDEKPKIAGSDESSRAQILQPAKTLPSLHDLISLLKTSATFSQAAIVAFFSNLADVGLHASMMLLLMPLLAPALGEEKLLSIGLFFSCAHMFLYGVAWSFWMRSIVSKQVGPSEQGKAQGCISGICSFANVISPIAFSPLTDDSLYSKRDDKGCSSRLKSTGQQPLHSHGTLNSTM
ncbi:Major facilitator superfamily protein [Prunus dulcis]|uniref:Major facilitator superfamily protein n=1 Tax=Prunus dulcis TaxID=3755 RepID=A0A4Y1QSD8_PRUDU|nr:Major facilitator superfamily protein [Prunus dulcis]